MNVVQFSPIKVAFSGCKFGQWCIASGVECQSVPLGGVCRKKFIENIGSSRLKKVAAAVIARVRPCSCAGVSVRFFSWFCGRKWCCVVFGVVACGVLFVLHLTGHPRDDVYGVCSFRRQYFLFRTVPEEPLDVTIDGIRVCRR